MSAQIEAKHQVYATVEEMLAPQTLSHLLAKKITRVALQPMNGHGGLAGGRLSYVMTDGGRFVLKQLSIESDWIMFASDDRQCRSVTLWQYGLLDQLQPHAEHKIITCARDGKGWAILMTDLTGSTLSWATPLTVGMVNAFLDTLARLHATFWNNGDIDNPVLGICTPQQLLDQTALPLARKYPDYATSPIPGWVCRGWDVLPELLPPQVLEKLQRLIENPQPLYAALQRYPSTLLHGDYRIENFAYCDGCPVLLDWQESTCSVMTTDLAWLVKQGYVQNVMSREQATAHYRSRLETYLGTPFPEREWQQLLDLGCCLDSLRSIGFSAYFYKATDDPLRKRADAQLVQQQSRFVLDAMNWF